ncbi:DUF4244 domain-containing protein [Streptomyces sp. KLOTTS4A1]|uniref:DUF4244 domain-containing protein n=1 Tax=Streptomyces sp. KLOTTS4A1 TaxID=3390996 RepID=UPI0039F4FC52
MRFFRSEEDGRSFGGVVASLLRRAVGAGRRMSGVVRRAWCARLARMRGADAGMTTSEYALGTVAACAFAAVLYKVVSSGAVKKLLEGVIEKALGGQF